MKLGMGIISLETCHFDIYSSLVMKNSHINDKLHYFVLFTQWQAYKVYQIEGDVVGGICSVNGRVEMHTEL
jgi:hypothetical protein